ncbi:hypothetical protein BDY21DRAFT_330509 [Lineolata rhizophorae]|uniref:Uncharacterized protein n=1 Tax=Lineolata rhizophorae TaxID=578093 RepID=A0A6A6PFH7_9PEZI|nr:hypothetical protein BDY21DRAFT_330509 [Lineolata rhizophorae]
MNGAFANIVCAHDAAAPQKNPKSAKFSRGNKRLIEQSTVSAPLRRSKRLRTPPKPPPPPTMPKKRALSDRLSPKREPDPERAIKRRRTPLSVGPPSSVLAKRASVEVEPDEDFVERPRKRSKTPSTIEQPPKVRAKRLRDEEHSEGKCRGEKRMREESTSDNSNGLDPIVESVETVDISAEVERRLREKHEQRRKKNMLVRKRDLDAFQEDAEYESDETWNREYLTGGSRRKRSKRDEEEDRTTERPPKRPHYMLDSEIDDDGDCTTPRKRKMVDKGEMA